MDKIKRFAPIMAFCILFIKMIATSSFQDGAVASLFIISLLVFLLEVNLKNVQNEKFEKEQEEMKKQIEMFAAQIAEQKKLIEETRTHVGSMKLLQQYKQSNMR